MNILVFGAGAVGSYLGGMLARSGHAVTLVCRPTAADTINTSGLALTLNRTKTVVRPRAVISLRQALLENAAYDVMLLTMKSYDIDTAVNEIAAFYKNPPLMIAWQNGIGIEERLEAEFGAEHVLAGTVTTPVSLDGSFGVHVEKGGRGVGLAPLDKRQKIKPWVKLFKSTGIRTASVKDYRSLKWSKVLTNIFGNASAAILNRHPRAIYQYQPTFNMEMEMINEMLAVMEKAGIAPVDLPGVATGRLIFGIQNLPRGLAQPILKWLVASGRGDKMPSFQLDLSLGKVKNEVVYHNGAIALYGQKLGVPTPVNAALNSVLWRIVQKKLDWQEFSGKPDRLLDEVRLFKRRYRERSGQQAVNEG